jgi:hypothetical protein
VSNCIRQLDTDDLRRCFAASEPFPFVKIDDFLEQGFAQDVADSYPRFDEAVGMGRMFEAVNERRKLQITEAGLFPPPVARLHQELSSPAFLAQVSAITGIGDLLADPGLDGGGMHLTESTGWLDVHVDFNLLLPQRWHRRLNILLYLNPAWQSEWGGYLELWDRDVEVCHHSFAPSFNRCVIFETSEISYHGVTPVRCPSGVARKSFAAYYYTEAPPQRWDGRSHSTVFRARPDERVKRYVLMPIERLGRRVGELGRAVKGAVKRVLGRAP